MVAVRSLILVSLLSMAGCTFVKPSEQAVSVRVGAAEDVVNCKRMGQTAVSTLAQVAGMPRYESSIQDELNTLARNSGANMGGDTIVPAAPQKDGNQTFIVYRCRP